MNSPIVAQSDQAAGSLHGATNGGVILPQLAKDQPIAIGQNNLQAERADNGAATAPDIYIVLIVGAATGVSILLLSERTKK
jgi:hypothetical protein